MTLVLTLLVSDEVDLVEPLLDYYLDRGVDLVILTTNRAPEEVIEKLVPYVERGVARILREDATVFAQDEWVTRMARLAAEEHGADWVLNVDADEFFWPEAGTFKEILAAVPPELGALEVPVCHFLPRPDERGFFADRMTVREVRSLKPSGRAVFSKCVHRATPDVQVSIGNHHAKGTGLELLVGWHPIVGLHFPLRSYDQFERRVVRDLRADPSLGWKRYPDRLRLHRSGRLREAYERDVLDEREAERGIEEGRLVVDERLKHFFATKDETGGSEPPAYDAERAEELRLEARRAIVEFQSHPLYFEAERLRYKLVKARHGRRSFRRRQDHAERRRDELKAEIAAMRSTWHFKVGARIAPLLAGARGRRQRR